MQFMLNGVGHELTADQVRERLRDVVPGRVRHQGVRVGKHVYPIKQAFEVATGLQRNDFTASGARQHFAALGFELIGENEPDPDGQDAAPAIGVNIEVAPPAARSAAAREEWHTKASVQATLVAYLVGKGWRITSVADRRAHEGRADVVAARDGETLAVEVEGYPTRSHNAPSRSSDRKPTLAGAQAVHWYAEAVLAAMRTRSRRPEARCVVALPDFGSYRELYDETAGSLKLSGIDVWWIDQDGLVDRNALDQAFEGSDRA